MGNYYAAKFAKLLKVKPTQAELVFQERLIRAGIKFEFQKAYEIFVFDFYLPHQRMVIEIDGGYHETKKQKEKDAARDEFCKSKRLRVTRIKNKDVESFDISVFKLSRVELTEIQKQKEIKSHAEISELDIRYEYIGF